MTKQYMHLFRKQFLNREQKLITVIPVKYCNLLQHTATTQVFARRRSNTTKSTATHYYTHATHCNTHHPLTHCNTLQEPRSSPNRAAIRRLDSDIITYRPQRKTRLHTQIRHAEDFFLASGSMCHCCSARVGCVLCTLKNYGSQESGEE